MAAEEHSQLEQRSPRDTVEVPSPTASPMVFAFGIALVFAGLATSAGVSVVGALCVIAGAVSWFRAVLPHEAHEAVLRQLPPPPVVTMRREVVHLHVVRGSERAWLPVEIYPVSAGIRGGLVGGAAMAIIACLYGLVTGHGIWYPVNLLAASFLPSVALQTAEELGRFQATPFAVACAVHVVGSVLVGLLYGALLPILPRRPVLLAGLAAPLFWTALLHSTIWILDPVLNARVDWTWFVVSQLGYGIVAGIVVSMCERVRTWQGAPLAVRAGLEAAGPDPGKETKR